MIGDYDWADIMSLLKKFASVEDIRDIIIVGENEGVRRIMVGEAGDENRD